MGTAMDSSRQIEDQAAEWLARRDSEDWSVADQVALNEWLRESTQHRVAYLRLEAAWDHAQRLQALAAGTARGTIPARGKWRVSPFFPRRSTSALDDEINKRAELRTQYLVFAFTILLSLGVVFYLTLFSHRNDYRTPVGGTASIPLRDGSRVTLNTASKIRVALTKAERAVELENGEAFFEVAKDSSRPFVVHAGDKRVVAVGTKFSVRREATDVSVVVTEGAVRIESDSPNASGSGAALLEAGNVARASGSAAVQVEARAVADVEQALSWRSGYLSFDETTLADAVAEFNRYTSRKIYIGDPTVAALRINGKFKVSNAEAFIRVLRDGFGIDAQEQGDTITLTHHAEVREGSPRP